MAQKGDVDLGFIASVADWKLRCKFFPSKVGGKPAWLNLSDLPSVEDLLCAACSQPQVHLLQLYAPIEDIDSCFHRTIFVFVCKNPECCQPNSTENFKVFRCQLPRNNSFYSYEPPEEVESGDVGPSASDYLKLCSLCGCRGPKKCSQCQTTYCSAQHQRIDWKLGHKAKCRGLEECPDQDERPKHTLLEYEIVMETEDYDEPNMKEQTEEERIEEYEKYVQRKSSLGEEDLKDLENMAKCKSDKWFRRFQEIIKPDPEQIIRYQRGGTPLWVSKENIHSADSIPPCPCGANRQFEFQILPQLLNGLELDDVGKSIDWGTLLIYTCSNFCDHENKAYQKEYIFKQDFSSENA